MALTKIINDENRGYRPVLTDKLILDAKPTVNSFNAITSDAVARAVAGASGEVPAVEEGDNGKVLTAIYDEGGAAVEWADAPTEIPDMTGQDGKILGAVDVEGTVEAQWINPPTELPASLGTAGQVLTVNSGATGVEWANVPTELPDATSADNGKVLGVTDTSGTLDWVAQTPAQVNSDWNAASGAAQILNKPSLATVATSGSYSDLTNKPTIPDAQVNSDWNASSGVSEILNKPNLAAVATSGSYYDLEYRPEAGTGITITSGISSGDIIAADIDNSTIKTATVSSTLQEATSLNQISSVYGSFRINADVKAKLTQTSSASGRKLKIHIPGNMFSYSGDVSSDNVYVELSNNENFSKGSNYTALYQVALSVTYDSQQQKTYIDEQDVEISCYMADWLSGSTTLAPTSLDPATSSSSTRWYMGFFRVQGTGTSNQAYGASSSFLPPDYQVVISEEVVSNKICVANPVPAFTSLDNGKVLGVVNGALAWVSLT